ncbi:hypothetical protein LTR36_002099 [Oleoguttula mirabilis]|uniref:Uncharacterized protein n=1 Tax=Oleoguttula mirabilis TaxID=1507867 RepID=A0AAV9JPE5_9PEZI|nr:hypothetical protein LTR36_002099 [Oleoguttula mirabilis]
MSLPTSIGRSDFMAVRKAANAMPCYKNSHRHTQHSVVFDWLLQIGERNTSLLRRVEVDVGTWVSRLNLSWMGSPQLDSMLGELSAFFKRSNTSCMFAVTLDWTEKAGGGNLGTLHLPLLDFNEARDINSRTFKNEAERLKHAREGGQLGWRQAIYLKADLHH